MRVMVLVMSNEDAEQANYADRVEDYAAVARYNEELIKAGVSLAAEGLTPSSEAKRVVFGAGGSGMRLIDGPFAEAKEVLGGFSIWQVSSMEEALEWIKRAPSALFRNGTIEVRRIVDASDFEGQLPDELIETMEAENRLQAEVNQNRD